jgi:hypothetical protein
MIEEALTTYILAQAGITALISRRFGFDEMPLGTELPYLTAGCISNVLTHTHQGQNAGESPIYQITAYAATRKTARSLAEAVKAALCDFSGTMGGLEVAYITLLNDLPDTLSNSDGTVKIHAVALEFQIDYYKE